jgi:hypothetical protein
VRGRRRKILLGSRACLVAPPGLLEKLAPGKKTYIGQGEIMYAVAPYTSAPDVLRDCKVLHFVDNVGALTALIKGYARSRRPVGAHAMWPAQGAPRH